MSDAEGQAGELSPNQRQVFDWLMAMGDESYEIKIESASDGEALTAMGQGISTWTSAGLLPLPQRVLRPWEKVFMRSNGHQLARAAFLRKLSQWSG